MFEIIVQKGDRYYVNRILIDTGGYDSIQDGATPSKIAHALTEQDIPTPKGKATWHSGTITNILRNEKYCCDALMQKTCTNTMKFDFNALDFENLDANNGSSHDFWAIRPV